MQSFSSVCERHLEDGVNLVLNCHTCAGTSPPKGTRAAKKVRNHRTGKVRFAQYGSCRSSSERSDRSNAMSDSVNMQTASDPGQVLLDPTRLTLQNTFAPACASSSFRDYSDVTPNAQDYLFQPDPGVVTGAIPTMTAQPYEAGSAAKQRDLLRHQVAWGATELQYPSFEPTFVPQNIRSDATCFFDTQAADPWTFPVMPYSAMPYSSDDQAQGDM